MLGVTGQRLLGGVCWGFSGGVVAGGGSGFAKGERVWEERGERRFGLSVGVCFLVVVELRWCCWEGEWWCLATVS